MSENIYKVEVTEETLREWVAEIKNYQLDPSDGNHYQDPRIIETMMGYAVAHLKRRLKGLDASGLGMSKN